jgi:hypothetical protein
LLLRISTDGRLWWSRKNAINQKRRRKAGQMERSHREGHDGWAGRVKNFRALAMLKTTPLGCEKKQSVSEEARPVASGERADKIGG